MKKVYLQPEVAEMECFVEEELMQTASVETGTVEYGGVVDDPDFIRQMLPGNEAGDALKDMFKFGIFN